MGRYYIFYGNRAVQKNSIFGFFNHFIMHKFTNRLIHETSPYLLQHAHNPVDWYAWGNEALHRAKTEDKPMLVSIGYAACHWCHVMERESFEDEDTATLMNEYFINIKIDREERPDLDHIYMDAVQAMSGSGGWPLNVFLTPEGKPFYGGTYFPPVRAFSRMSWKEVLEAVHQAYKERKEEIMTQAQNLTEYMMNSNSLGQKKSDDAKTQSKETLDEIAKNILASADTAWGGFGSAPKFPQTFSIQYLLRNYYFKQHEPSLKQALLSLDKMSRGGIFDHLGGGFARYSTDNKWLAPHFEKMLYDNALLITVFAEAYQLTGKNEYADVIRETIAFVQREMTSPQGGFYSALDADSEGEEGKYYTWHKEEIDAILEKDSELFCKVYNATDRGNWEHKNILWLQKSLDEYADELQMNIENLKKILNKLKQKLLSARQKRIRPALDDKILLGWNSLMITGLCKAYASLGDAVYLEMAVTNIRFIENNFWDKNGEWKHTWKNDIAKYPAFLDDYAYLIQAYIQLQEVTGNQTYLIKAKNLSEKVIENFSDEQNLFFYFTTSVQEDIIVRKKEMYDGAVPSGNAVMADNLIYLQIVFDKPGYRTRAEEMLYTLVKAALRYPTSFGVWCALLQHVVHGFNEIAIVGPLFKEKLKEVIAEFIPNRVIQSSVYAKDEFPLLAKKENNEGKTFVYLCRNYSCERPVEKISELRSLLKWN